MRIFIEPLKRSKQLIIFGAGHVGSAIAEFARSLEFKTILVDERESILNAVKIPSLQKVQRNHRDAFQELQFDKDTYIVICTHLHEFDREILAYCINQPHAYLGMIGSIRKVLVTRKRFLLQNLASKEQLEKVDMPIGFDIGQNTPAEISLGIIAKVVAVANGKDALQMAEITEHEETGFDNNGCS
jgi:xanthine dehydrogenase accessory factor